MYEVKLVFISGSQYEYYVVNMSAKTVQSAWSNYREAAYCARKLNDATA